MEKVCLIGGAGFIGTNIALSLDGKADLKLVDRDAANMQRLKKLLKSDAEFQTGNLCRDMDLDALVKGTDTLFHLVSTTKPANANQDIPGEIQDNIVFTSRLLEACVRNKVKKIVFFSSGGTIYGRDAECPIKEDAETKPISSYGMHKLAIEKMLYLYNYLYGIDNRVIRLSNPYGPYQRPDGQLGVAAAFVYRVLTGTPVEIYGDGSNVRDFIYIDDAVKGIMNVAFGNSRQRVFNLGSGRGTSINDLLETVCRIVGKTADIQYLPERKADVPENILDTERYTSCYGSLAETGLEEGIRMTCDHMRKEYGI